MSTTWYPPDSIPLPVGALGTTQPFFSVDLLSFTMPGNSVGQYVTAHANLAITSGKYQFEWILSQTDTGGPAVGVDKVGNRVSLGTFIGGATSTGSWAYYTSGIVLNASNTILTGPTYTVADVIGTFLDATNGIVWWTKNGVSISGNPLTGSGGFAVGTAQWLPAVSLAGDFGAPLIADSGTANFGGKPFVYPVNGFAPWTSFNIPPFGAPKLVPYWNV